MTRPKAETATEVIRNQARDLAIMQRRGRGRPSSGDTGLRDTAYEPANEYERVALAESGIVWYNTDRGYEERYFAGLDDAGSTVQNAATVPGWYPMRGTLFIHLGFDYSSRNWTTETLFNAFEDIYDPYDLRSVVGAPHRILPDVAGWYDVQIEGWWETDGAGDRFISLFYNGARHGGVSTTVTVGNSPMSGMVVEPFNGTTDYVHFMGYWNSGSNSPLHGNISLRYMRPV
jgi:hypothetical protein